MNKIEFKFGQPEHGWMEFKISDAANDVVLDVSDVPNNCLEALALALSNLQKGSLVEEVEFSLEPGFALLRFSSMQKNLELAVYPDQARLNPVKFTGVKSEMLYRLFKGLKSLGALDCWRDRDFNIRIWSWDFPYEELDEYNKNNA